MSCKPEWKTQIEIFFSQGVSFDASAKLRTHLQQCAPCRNTFQLYKEKKLKPLVPEPQPDPELRFKQLETLREDLKSGALLPRSRPHQLRTLAIAFIAMAGLAYIAVRFRPAPRLVTDIYIDKNQREEGVSKASEDHKLRVYPGDKVAPLEDLRAKPKEAIISPGTPLTFEIHNGEVKRFFFPVIVDEQFRIHSLIDGEESRPLAYYAKKKEQLRIKDFPGHLKSGTCLLMTIFSDRKLKKAEIAQVVGQWKARKIHLRDVHTFQLGTWIINALLLEARL